MKMPKYKLFLGFPVSENYHQSLNKIDPDLRTLFIKNGSEYLQEVHHNKKYYLGKFIGDKSNLSGLRLLEDNIYSVLKRLVPDHSYEKTPLLLFPAEEK